MLYIACEKGSGQLYPILSRNPSSPPKKKKCQGAHEDYTTNCTMRTPLAVYRLMHTLPFYVLLAPTRCYFLFAWSTFWCFLNIVCHFLCTISTPCSQMRLLVTLEPLATKNLDPMQRCLMWFLYRDYRIRTYTEPPMFLFFPQPVFISTVNKSHTPTLLLFCLALYCCPGLFINTSTHLYTACSSALLCCLFNILYIWGLYMNSELRKRANVGFIP